MHYSLPHENPDERKPERWFTISSAPFEKNVMITTRLSEKGSSFKRALMALPIGGSLEASVPDGDFVVDDAARELIFIAGGIGITPYRAMLLDLDYKNLLFNIKLLYVNRDNIFVFREELEGLAKKHAGFRIRYFVSPERIDELAIRRAAPDLTATIFYISGPEPMVEMLEKTLLKMGVPETHIKRDYFPGYTWP